MYIVIVVACLYIVFSFCMFACVFLILNLREMMVDAHQNQIQELRESFKQKISQADRWPIKVSKKNTDFIKGYIV